MKPRGAPSVSADELRAAKLSRVPGVTIAEACERFAVTKAGITRARKLPDSKPSLGELALAALTSNGTQTSGTIDALDGVRSWLAYVDKCEYSIDEVRAMLAPLDQLELGPTRWRLRRPWP